MTQNGSTVALSSWGANTLPIMWVGLSRMYEKNEQTHPVQSKFLCENTNGNDLYIYEILSNDRGYFVSNQAFASTSGNTLVLDFVGPGTTAITIQASDVPVLLTEH